MYFNGKELTKEHFILEDKNLNSLGLQAYALDLSQNLGVSCIGVETEDKSFLARYDFEDKIIIVNSKFFLYEFTENIYRAVKGAIDHEAGHVIWPDYSYFKFNNEHNADKGFIEDIGNIIDDIRVEQYLSNEFGINKNNFGEMIEYSYSLMNEEKINSYAQDLISNLSWFVNEKYFCVKPSFLGSRIIHGKILYLQYMLTKIIDNYLCSGSNAVIPAQELLALLKSKDNKNVLFLKKLSSNLFIIDIEGKILYINFFPSFKHNFKEGVNVTMENIISVYGEIMHLVKIG